MADLDASQITELDIARKLFWLMREDKIFFGSYNESKKTWDDGVYPAINCNDVFVMGADAESLQAEDLDAFIEVVKRFPNVADYAWCAYKRSATPWNIAVRDSKEFKEALEEIPKIVEEFNRKKNESPVKDRMTCCKHAENGKFMDECDGLCAR